ncbi:PREDICTED: sodium/potassium-transporting ATPase subunit beta-3 [Hipposideros armiger]|uniref:Sodium/potassium-transporting ATPase subunit beta-3 n=1 Tax=Hipposideros armiger TaxID=186990 RepID=A0A8B7RK94_HIPAR|nr:PREDICTED: sodium/potassium-transporting ATPase subunit beta-3 [Hipposideros armiger]
MTKKDKKSFNQSLAEWKLFIYNPTTGAFLGRTAKSWGLILLFYLVFYGFLAALFTFTMWAMLQTLNDEVPKYRDQISSPGVYELQLLHSWAITWCGQSLPSSLLGSEWWWLTVVFICPPFMINDVKTDANLHNNLTLVYCAFPGNLLKLTPPNIIFYLQLKMVFKVVASAIFWPATQFSWVSPMYTGAYGSEEQKNLKDCSNGTVIEKQGPVYDVCQFPVGLLEESSGVNDPNFGYSRGHPCILVKMNRIIGLKPQGTPRIECSNQKGDDNVTLTVYPPGGIVDLKYFPYYGKKLHVSI